MKVANYQLDEIFQMINDSENPETSLVQIYKSQPLIKLYTLLACNDEWINFDIEDLNYKFSDFHRSMCGAYLLSKSTSRIIEEIIYHPYITMKSKFFHTKNLMELLSKEEAAVFEAILKKDLTSLYPKLTHSILVNSTVDVK